MCAAGILGGQVPVERSGPWSRGLRQHALMVRVLGIDLDAGQRSLGVARSDRRRRWDPAVVVSAELAVGLQRRHHPESGIDGLRARIRERAVGNLGQLSWVGLVVSEGDLQRAKQRKYDRSTTPRQGPSRTPRWSSRRRARRWRVTVERSPRWPVLGRDEDAGLVDLSKVVGIGGAHVTGMDAVLAAYRW